MAETGPLFDKADCRPQRRALDRSQELETSAFSGAATMLFRSGWPRNKRIKKPMPLDTLFILPMSFVSEGLKQFCPECSELWGLIGWFPDLKATMEIVLVEIEHPRPAISALLGEGRHNAPTLVLHAGSERVRGLAYAEVNGYTYLASARLIARHFATIHGTPSPRGE